MKQLENLIIEAKILTEPEMEVERVMQVCNACRYCEGFCAVFPAMTQRLEFGKADINYLANLCHNCGACLYACQYAPPHEFAINVPKAMAEVRLETYQHYARPAAFGALYHRAGIAVTLALTCSLILFLLLTIALKGSLLHEPLAGDFYQIYPHSLLAWMFGSVFVIALGLLMAGVIRFWREISPGAPESIDVARASHDALTLKYLDGGHGKGCNEADDAFTLMRRRFHHFTFYGFMLCFAATVVATGYHYVAGWEAPYPFFSLPVVLGTLGGVGLIIGPAGLLWLNMRRSPLQGDPRQKPMDRGFILLLLLISITGLALLAGRDTGWMGVLLSVHLGAVMALFLTLPYGKFAHGFYRCAALLKWAIEKRRGKQPGIAGD
ncbi:tricarballylate utilization protein B [Pluralibacter gergoviae]|uniref:tricarballylate utilization 4Fe-4S protein TcuB n=1 Tax=Pluralibacter gergoviae TaxID=61647 RepID=UPI000650C282|nr:tricarballylate utilization 4Fe-4S protein TcuB [Pluralibacter gergoviae]AVR03387.1 tricarballylate utilization protein TcuB [Pluralibacter gergoviae]KMK05538.1 tricarballylate utilization protein B [Pluralibacter gergoviae]KMK10808.1 tricarballylate utilization protein B [Pluralibacter gergoviae]KMK29706.1 tricarballylate utilization protein B [Pluralibacter gergoviae]SUB72597.1 tricarballylate utilization protein B [Pluralibacter gergoviae]